MRLRAGPHPEPDCRLTPAGRRLALALALALAALAGGCGYHAVYGGERPAVRLTVALAPPLVPRADAVQEVLFGTRSELSAAGVLAPGAAYPRVVVQVVRIDELSSGISRTTDERSEKLPLARGSRVAVVARAWVEESRGAAPSRDTGDVQRTELYASEADTRLEVVRHDAAVRAASRRLGRALGRSLLGAPEPPEEAL